MIDTIARRFTKHVLHTLASKGFWKEKGVLFIIFMAVLYRLVSDILSAGVARVYFDAAVLYRLVSDILSLCYRNLN